MFLLLKLFHGMMIHTDSPRDNFSEEIHGDLHVIIYGTILPVFEENIHDEWEEHTVI
jgi:hypothetical protein